MYLWISCRADLSISWMPWGNYTFQNIIDTLYNCKHTLSLQFPITIEFQIASYPTSQKVCMYVLRMSVASRSACCIRGHWYALNWVAFGITIACSTCSSLLCNMQHRMIQTKFKIICWKCTCSKSTKCLRNQK